MLGSSALFALPPPEDGAATAGAARQRDAYKLTAGGHGAVKQGLLQFVASLHSLEPLRVR